MGLYEEAAADAAQILAEAGRTIRFRNTDVLAMVGEQNLGYDLERGGMVPTGQLTIKLLHASYASALPTDGEHLEYAGVKYRVSSVTRRPPTAWVQLACEPFN